MANRTSNCLGRARAGWVEASAALLILSPAVSTAQIRADETVVTAAHRSLDLRASAAALDRAISGKDRQSLDRLIAEDLLWVRGSGATAGKTEFIATLTSPSLAIEPFSPTDIRWFESADTGSLTGVNVLRGRQNGLDFVDRHRFIDYWALRGGRWVLVYVQVTPLGDPG